MSALHHRVWAAGMANAPARRQLDRREQTRSWRLACFALGVAVGAMVVALVVGR